MQAIEKRENNKGRGRPESILGALRLSKYHLAQVISPGASTPWQCLKMPPKWPQIPPN